MEKHYATDWVKGKARERLRGMIENTLLEFRRPQDLKVLCFPGIDAAEIFDIYDPLGIPRENIVGLERDRYTAGRIQNQGLGIEVVNCSVEDYVKRAESLDFDILSFDYTGPLSNDHKDVIKNVRERQVRNHFVFHQANLLKRGVDSVGTYAIGVIGGMPVQGEKECDIKKRIEGFFDKVVEGGSIREYKEVGYSATLIPLFEGLNLEELDGVFRFIFGYSISWDHYIRQIKHLEKTLSMASNEEVTIDPDNVLLSLTRSFGAYSFHIFPIIMREVLKSVLRNKGIVDDIADPLYTVLGSAVTKNKIFFVKDIEAYSYISESGSPMIGDILFLSYPRYYVEAAREAARSVGYPHHLKVNDPYSMIRALQRFAKIRDKFLSSEDRAQLREKFKKKREFLGNSSKPVLTKNKAIEEFRNGAIIEQLLERYRGCKPRRLAAWKAHMTMGTYELKPALEADDNGDLELISKEDAIHLLSSEIPPEEIYAAYPTSFSLGQLRAFKAHITMGTYGEA